MNIPGMKLIKKMKVWVEGFAEHPQAGLILFLLAFMESSFFPIPPDVLLIALAATIPTKSFKYALYCTLGSFFGGLAGYAMGHYAWEVLSPLFFNYIPGFHEDKWLQVKELYDENAVIALLTAAFTPIPFKIFTVSSGVFETPLTTFATFSLIGRAARFFLVASLFYFFGKQIKSFIDKYFEILTIGFTVLLILGFISMKWLF